MDMNLKPLMKFLPFSLIIIFALPSLAQDSIPSLSAKPRKTDAFWHRISVGGQVGFQFGSVTGIVVSPEIRIRTIDQLNLGLGFTYQYSKYKDYYWDDVNKDYIDFQSNVYGGRVYLRYYLRSLFDNFFGNFFAHVEYEYLFYTQPYSFDPGGTIYDPGWNRVSKGRQNVEISSVFVGGGYAQTLGGRAFMDIMILFNLNESYNSPYSNPIFRIGFGVGL